MMVPVMVERRLVGHLGNLLDCSINYELFHRGLVM
jgi:hypothetical protein